MVFKDEFARDVFKRKYFQKKFEINNEDLMTGLVTNAARYKHRFIAFIATYKKFPDLW